MRRTLYRNIESKILSAWSEVMLEEQIVQDRRIPDKAIVKMLTSLYSRALKINSTWLPDCKESYLAKVIVYDQVPRLIFRKTCKAYATDRLARQASGQAIDDRADLLLSLEQRAVLYQPFTHSEVLVDQKRAVGLYKQLGITTLVRRAERRHEIILRFSRFPHRNLVLGRKNSLDEMIFLRESIEEKYF